jgi:predicted GTPase
MDKTAKGESLKLEDVKEIEYFVPKVHDFMDKILKKHVYLSVYDLPGLNDSMTKDVYYKWIENSFHKFDVIIFVVDINSALNTSDETDIMNMILRNMKKNNTNGIHTEMILLLNKCDDMVIETVNNAEIPVPADDEFKEMKDQVIKITKTLKDEIFPEANVTAVCISCEDAFIYRMYNMDPDVKLDMKHLNKFGSNEYGKSKWNRLKEDEKQDAIKEIFAKFDYENVIKLTGFSLFNKKISQIILKNQHTFIVNHVKYDVSKISYMKCDDMLEKIDRLNKYKISVENISKLFKTPIDTVFITDKIKEITNGCRKEHTKFFISQVDSPTSHTIVNKLKNIWTDITKIFPDISSEHSKDIEVLDKNKLDYVKREILKYNTISRDDLDNYISELFNSMKMDEFRLILTSILNNAYQYKFLITKGLLDLIPVNPTDNYYNECGLIEFVQELCIIYGVCEIDVLECLVYNSDGMIKELTDNTFYHVSVDIATLLDTYYITPDSQYYEYFMKLKRWTIWATAKGYKPCNKYNPVNDIVSKIFEMCAKQCKYICLSKDIVTAVNEIFKEKSKQLNIKLI